jgi:hypothetical protein
MNVIVRGVQKIPVTNNQINNRIFFLIRLSCRVATENLKDCSSVVKAGRHLAVGIVILFSSGPAQPFDLIPFRLMDGSEVRIGVTARRVEVNLEPYERDLKPILEMKLFVLRADGLNKLSIMYSLRTFCENVITASHVCS